MTANSLSIASFGPEEVVTAGSYETHRARNFVTSSDIARIAGSEERNRLTFIPTKDLQRMTVRRSRVSAHELFYSAWAALALALLATFADVTLKRSLVSGTLILMLMVAGFGLGTTAWLAQRDMSDRSR